MSDEPTTSWPEANERYLLAMVDVVRAALESHAARLAGREVEDRSADAARAVEEAAAALPGPAALDQLSSILNLSPFERGALLLGLGLETDAGFATLCAAAQGDAGRAYPTFQLALDVLPDAQRGALSPDAALRRWRLVEVGSGNSLVSSPLRLSERVLHYLFGVEHLDERLARLLETAPVPAGLAPSHQVLAERVAAIWRPVDSAADFPVIQLVGGEVADRQAIAARACALMGRQLRVLPVYLLPTQPEDLEPLRRLWELEGALTGAALLIEGGEAIGREGARLREESLSWLAGRVLGGVVVSGAERRRGWQRPLVTFDVATPPAAEQRDLWREALGRAGAELDGEVERLASQFHLGAAAIRSASVDALARRASGDEGDDGAPGSEKTGGGTLADSLWQACRLQARPRLDDLAQRIEPAATWEELALPDLQRDVLRQVAIHVRERMVVYEKWGFAEKGQRGLGISALLAGSSGTGKTMAAEVLAGELSLDLYRIDLSAVVSKYIGETEKNLRRVFAAAEAGGTILLFDEADALFGKRTAVQDSHDRHANIEVSYLLQRMEAYRGLAILTTNMLSALDAAFLRRIRFVVDFPFPDAELRAEIWRKIFPQATPTEGLDEEKLAQLNVAGGTIRNIAMNSAFLAADGGEPVGMEHVLRAAKGEYAKLKKDLTPSETRGWGVGGAW